MSKASVVVATIARVLLGLPFVFFGSNGLLHFMPMPPMTGPGGAFIGALVAAGYMMPLLAATQVAGGALVLSGRLLPLGLVVLAPVLVNIDLFHLVLLPQGAAMGIILTVLEIYLAWVYRDSFRGLFHASLKKAP